MNTMALDSFPSYSTYTTQIKIILLMTETEKMNNNLSYIQKGLNRLHMYSTYFFAILHTRYSFAVDGILQFQCYHTTQSLKLL
jgi:hypothetical protein